MIEQFQQRFAAAIGDMVAHFSDDANVANVADFSGLVRESQNPQFGDYQGNMAMSLAKKLGKPPREIAQKIVNRLKIDDLCEPPVIAGPGFINLRLKDDALCRCLMEVAESDRLAVPLATAPKKFVIDFSAPNVAKPMHVGHIRSTVIGNSLAKLLRFLGHTVITDNHLGDWGTQFGVMIYGYKHFWDAANYQTNPVAELARLYRHVRQLAENDPQVAAAVLEETAKLHHGDPDNRWLWNQFMPECLREIQQIYDRLNVTFDVTLGESFYNDMLPELVETLVQSGLATETEGAIGIFLDGYDVPMLIRKKDGAFLYATTDLATIQYRLKTWQPDVIVYVVDFRQSLHFEQLFAATTKWLAATETPVPELVHVKFGTVLGEDGKAFKTRSGETVGLESLLDEAENRALAILTAQWTPDTMTAGNVATRSDRFPVSTENTATTGHSDGVPFQSSFPATIQTPQETARRIGIGAILYCDLSQNRESDYVFSYDKMLAMNGNTATYLQYAVARIRSIFAKLPPNQQNQTEIAAEMMAAGQNQRSFTHPAERALVLAILKFSDSLVSAAADYRPNLLTAYLFDLANCYSSFFEQCPVLKAESPEVRNWRLFLCEQTARTLTMGLDILGIDTVERM